MTQPRDPNAPPPPDSPDSLDPPAAVAPEPLVWDSSRMAHKAAAFLLGYPDTAFWSLLPEIEASLRRESDNPPLAILAGAASALRQLGEAALAPLYVATFDFNEAASLYLTAHELGDSRRRGSALLELRQMVRAAGFESSLPELPDYLPLLLEFLACAPPEVETGGLASRLATVCAHIHAKLAAENPYQPIFAALLAVLPPVEETAAGTPFPLREGADTGEMPYPLRYT